ncbi:MAG TPA: penicillin-binding transpeptidase domain-containing protein [Tepidimicrobium sp.]|nr:penicillin-binding transpeptidase domain-containing protein [Tepidimicrobium sp.]
MRKGIFVIIFVALILALVGCSKKGAETPQDRFDQYVELWNDQQFEEMYDMLSSDAREEFPPDQFIDRYNKIYKDLGISKLKISYDELSEGELKTALKEGAATIPFVVSMESIGGPIEFEYKAILIKEGEGKDGKWLIKWDPGFIFPPLKDGGNVRIHTDTPMRGQILDRNKKPLATNDHVYEVGIVPEGLGENSKKQKEKIAKLLDIPVEAIDAELSADWVRPELFVPIKKLPKGAESTITELKEVDGVSIREVMGRVYPLGKAAGHLTGYIGPISAEELEEKEAGQYSANDLIGKRGLEQLYEEQLRGEKGAKIFIVKEDGEEEVLAEKSAKDGEDIVTTIDVDVQGEIFNAYEERSGTSAAINPKTGETLALVSSPAFDPNEFLYGISQERLDELENDPQTPVINRFAATFAPGSVIKPITAAIGLKNGTIKPDEGIDIKGLTWAKGKDWGNYKVKRVSESDGPVDIADALIRSDNIYFAMKGVEMGAKSLANGLEKFGFGEQLPFEYPIPSSTISSSGELGDEVQLANTSYGQAEVESSALHMAITYTTFLNEGNMLKPTLLASEDTGQIWKENIISPDNAKFIQEILRDVVLKGTATTAKRDGLAISGKTGTAELKLSHDSEDHENGWFIGYPTEKQDILIAMMIEEVEDIGTSAFVAEKVADILVKLNNR